MTGRNQIEQFIRDHADPSSLPVGRFELHGRKVRCVLCGRDGFGPVVFNPDKTWPERPRGHRILLQFFGDDLRQIEGPDTKPEPPKLMPWWCQFNPWQIGCMEDHTWPCSCGLSFRNFATLWRHIGAERPTGWGRQGVHEFALECEMSVVL
jgi:hypothetical protein